MAEELDPVLDPDVETALRAALSRLGTAPESTMPTQVWDRLERAIAHESGRRMGVVVEVVPRRRALRWVAPLVAVSAVVLGVMVVANLPADSGDVVASGGADVIASSESVAPLAKAASPSIAQAGFVPPTMTIVDSAQDFTPESLRAGVTAVLDQLGVRSVADLDEMAPPPSEPPADEAALRECVTDITESATSQALIVIRATYEGDEAGVVVIPAVMMGDVTTLDLSRISDPTLHIFVVGPQCGAQPARVITHVLHTVGR